MKNLLLFEVYLFAGKQYRNPRAVKVEKAVGSSCLVSLMDAEMFRGRGKPCLSRGERISLSRSWKREESRDAKHSFSFFFFFLTAGYFTFEKL